MTVAVISRSDIAVVGVKAVVAVACSVLVALVSRDSQHMQVAVVVRLMWRWSKGGQVGSVVVKRARAARAVKQRLTHTSGPTRDRENQELSRQRGGAAGNEAPRLTQIR